MSAYWAALSCHSYKVGSRRTSYELSEGSSFHGLPLLSRRLTMRFPCNLSPYSNPVSRKTPCPGLNLQPLPETMDPLNMHTRGDEMKGTPKELQMEFMEELERIIMTPSSSPQDNFDPGTGTPYTPGTLSTTPSGYSSRRESTTQIENAQTYSLASTGSPSLPSKITAASSFEAMSQTLDPSGQMYWMANEVAMYPYNESTTGLDIADSGQWADSLSGLSNTQVQGSMSNTEEKYGSAGRSLQMFGPHQSVHPCLPSSQVDLLRDDARGLAATASPPLGEAFEYSEPSPDTSTSGRTSSRKRSRHGSLEYRIAKVSQKRRSDLLCFSELGQHIPKIYPQDVIVVPREQHKDKTCDQCPKRFKRPEHAARHKKTHGENRWFCPICPRYITSDRRDNLVAHIRKTHLTPTEKTSAEKTNTRVSMRDFYENRALPDRRVFWIRIFLKDNHATDAYPFSEVELWRQQFLLHEPLQKLLRNEMTIHDCLTTKNGRQKEKPLMMWTMIGWSIQEAQHVLIRDIDPDYKGDPEKTIWDVDPRRKALLARELRLEHRKHLGTDMPGTQAMGLEHLDPAWIALKEGRLSPEEEVQYGAPMHLRGQGTVPKGTKPKRESRL